VPIFSASVLSTGFVKVRQNPVLVNDIRKIPWARFLKKEPRRVSAGSTSQSVEWSQSTIPNASRWFILDRKRHCNILSNAAKRGWIKWATVFKQSVLWRTQKKQTPDSGKNSYRLGFAVGSDWFGHGGAHATNMEIHYGKGIVLIWMVQHGGYPGKGKDTREEFKEWAFGNYGK
jgi:hypothetical protein